MLQGTNFEPIFVPSVLKIVTRAAFRLNLSETACIVYPL